MTGPELGLPTTIGTIALETAIASKNAPVVDLVSFMQYQGLLITSTVLGSWSHNFG
jgi:hypothetical protein